MQYLKYPWHNIIVKVYNYDSGRFKKKKVIVRCICYVEVQFPVVVFALKLPSCGYTLLSNSQWVVCAS